MATSSKILMTFAVAAMTMSVALAACEAGPGWFTEDVDWSCPEPFECQTEFCGCLGGSMTPTCAPFNNTVTAETIEKCAARRVTCTLNAALNTRNVWNASCQRWGDTLSWQYQAFYNDRQNMNLTTACMGDMCGLLAAINQTAMDAINGSYVCSFVNFSFPDPNNREVAGCVAAQDTYFGESMPMGECGTAACIETYCRCTGGTWNATALTTRDRDPCTQPAAQPSTTLWKTCLSAGLGCIAKAALDRYVPRASPANPDRCIAWSVPIAQDYLAYTTATNKQTTDLYKACNQSACELITRYTRADVSDVCTFAALNGVAATFQPYDPCPYVCPDRTCAFNLADCACTENAVVSSSDATFSLNVAADVDVTKTLTATGFATYGVSSGNCSDFDFTFTLGYAWKLAKADGTVVLRSNISTLVIPARFLVPETTYTLTLTARGLISSQMRERHWTFKAVAPTPVVSITKGGASLRIGASQTVKIDAVVIDVVGGGTSAWYCTANSGTCPSLSNSTNTSLIINGAVAGEYVITFSYRSSYNSSLTLTVVDGEVPLVRIIPASVPVTTSPQYVYLSTQRVLLASFVKYNSQFNLTYSWKIGDVEKSTSAILAVAASELTSTSVANLGSPTLNTITLNVSSTNANSQAVFGLATFVVVVVAPYSATLSVAKLGGGSTAEALTDTMTLTPATTPSLTTATAPFGASLTFSFEYFDVVSGLEAAVGVVATPSGSAFTASVPLYANTNVSWQSTVIRVVARLNGIVAATANGTLNITKPNIEQATAAQLAKISAITNPAEAVAAAGALRSLMQQNTNASARAEMAKGALDMMSRTMSNAASLSSTEQAAVFSTIGVALTSSASAAEKRAMTAQIKSVVLSALTGGNFDSSNANVLLDAISNMDGASGGSLSVNLASVLSNDPNQPVAEPKVVRSNGYVVTVVRQTGAALAGFQVTGENGVAAVVLPASLTFPGLSESDVFGIANVVLSTNPYGTEQPSGDTVTMDITSNGSPVSVSDLEDEIAIFVPNGAGFCAFYDEATSTWSTRGLRTVRTDDGFYCYSKHLTAFASFTGSSAASVALSMLVVLVAALVQLVMA